MQEVLSNCQDSSAPIKQQEFYILTLNDRPFLFRSDVAVIEEHWAWCEEASELVRQEFITEILPDEIVAKVHYEKRRAQLIATGFRFSDLDM